MKKPANRQSEAAKMKQKKVVKAMIDKGCSAKEAIKEAGYSDGYAHNPQKIMRTKTWKELMEEFLPENELAAVHKSLLTSKRVERLVLHKDTPDEDIAEMIKAANCTLKKIYIFMGEKHVMFWASNDKARTDALDMAYKLRGNYAANKLTIEKRLADFTDEELDELIAEEAKKIAK